MQKSRNERQGSNSSWMGERISNSRLSYHDLFILQIITICLSGNVRFSFILYKCFFHVFLQFRSISHAPSSTFFFFTQLWHFSLISLDSYKCTHIRIEIQRSKHFYLSFAQSVICQRRSNSSLALTLAMPKLERARQELQMPCSVTFLLGSAQNLFKVWHHQLTINFILPLRVRNSARR